MCIKSYRLSGFCHLQGVHTTIGNSPGSHIDVGEASPAAPSSTTKKVLTQVSHIDCNNNAQPVDIPGMVLKLIVAVFR